MIQGDLVSLYPFLYHMAEDGSWPSIKANGLLSTDRLLRLFEVPHAEREILTHERRPESVEISSPRYGTAVVRDQKPLRMSALDRCLTDMTPVQWLEMLNSRVFFWLQPKRLMGLLNAGPYRAQAQTVIVVDTASLLAVHAQSVRLSRINSGSTIYNPVPRGSDTFKTIGQYPHPPRRRAVAAANDVAELCVIGGVDDILDHVVRVERWRGQEFLEELAI
ncbi:MAG: hypothetical protein JWP19_1303 [Rhodoglobus sp.]|nr:hypothetical protein [Rhodoglobus sp.]